MSVSDAMYYQIRDENEKLRKAFDDFIDEIETCNYSGDHYQIPDDIFEKAIKSFDRTHQ